MAWSTEDTEEVSLILIRAEKYLSKLREIEREVNLGVGIFQNLISDNPTDVDGTPLSAANRTALKTRCVAKINAILPAETD